MNHYSLPYLPHPSTGGRPVRELSLAMKSVRFLAGIIKSKAKEKSWTQLGQSNQQHGQILILTALSIAQISKPLIESPGSCILGRVTKWFSGSTITRNQSSGFVWQMRKWHSLASTRHPMPYNKNMNKTNSLKSYYGGRVMMNDTASKDPAVVAALEAMQARNWEDLKTPSGHYGYWNISDRH